MVDREFQTTLDDIRRSRPLHVNYDVMLPVRSLSRQEMLRRIQAPGAYNLDPLHMFYLLKEKMRASDFFYKINKDNDGGVTKNELNLLFQVFCEGLGVFLGGGGEIIVMGLFAGLKAIN